MRKTAILISVCFTIACTTQKQILINGKKSYVIPKESEQVSPEEALRRITDLEDKFVASPDVKLFVIGGMLVGLGLRSPAPDADYSKPFDYYKNQLISVMETGETKTDYKVNEIVLKTYNNQSFMVVDYENEKDDFISFRSFQKGSYSAYHGFVRYAKGKPKEPAYKVLDEILNTVKIENK